LLCLLGYCPNLDFPLAVGKQWKRNYNGTYVGSNRPMARTVIYEIKGIEQITTPIGTFGAIKIESDDRSGPRDFWVTNYWYSPETRPSSNTNSTRLPMEQRDCKELLSLSNSLRQMPPKSQ